MARYVILKTQEGEGCDYMIACGKDYEIVESKKNMQEMEEYFVKYCFVNDEADDYSMEELAMSKRLRKDDDWLKELIIISLETGEINSVNLEAWFEKLSNWSINLQAEKEKQDQIEKDMMDLERLKELYPDRFK